MGYAPTDGIWTCTCGIRAHRASDYTTRVRPPRVSRNKHFRHSPVSSTAKQSCMKHVCVHARACVCVCVKMKRNCQTNVCMAHTLAQNWCNRVLQSIEKSVDVNYKNARRFIGKHCGCTRSFSQVIDVESGSKAWACFFQWFSLSARIDFAHLGEKQTHIHCNGTSSALTFCEKWKLETQADDGWSQT